MNDIKINLRPHVPPATWREPLSSIVLDARAPTTNPRGRLMKNLLRHASATSSFSTILSPFELQIYGREAKKEGMHPALYNATIEAVKERLAPAFRRPGTWRLYLRLPSTDEHSGRHVFNFSALPEREDNWSLAFTRPQSAVNNLDQNLTLPQETHNLLDGIFKKRKGRLAILGSSPGRAHTTHLIKKYLDTKNIGYHNFVEHHQHALHPYNTLTGSLRDALPLVGLYPATIFDALSLGDNLFQLRQIPGVSIANLYAPNKSYFDKLATLQLLPPDFFDAVLESYLLPKTCEKCMPSYIPAVRFAPMRRIASSRGHLLHVHPLRTEDENCPHEKQFHLLHNIYRPGTKKPSIENQLYDLALNHVISAGTLARYASA